MIHEDFTRYHQFVGTYTAFSIFCILIAYAVTLLLGLLSLTSPAEPIGDPYFSLMEILIIVLTSAVLLAIMLWVTWHVPAWLKFNRRDQIAIQFCGTKKSLATGVPMAAVLFPAWQVGIIVLPLMIFHQMQLMACATLASRYARQDQAWLDPVAVGNGRLHKPAKSNSRVSARCAGSTFLSAVSSDSVRPG